MKKIRWGVLSTARIGAEKVIPAMQLASIARLPLLLHANWKRHRQQPVN